MRITVEKLEEQWTPTTIQAAFVFSSSSSKSTLHRVPVNFPLLNLGWTFALSLLTLSRSGWTPAAFSFRQNGTTIRWGSTSMRAQLSFVKEQRDRGSSSGECVRDGTVESNSTLLGAIDVVLAQTSSTEVSLRSSRTVSLPWRTKVVLAVTVSECPFTNGLFDAASGQVNDPEAQARIARQSGDRHLSRSLTTGELFDVKFLARSARPSGNTGELIETYASLSVLEEHVDLSSAKLGEEWRSTLAALKSHNDVDSKYVGEIVSPKDDEYEFDSDFEDEGEASALVEPRASPRPDEHDVATLEGQPLETNGERSNSSLSSYALAGASDQGSLSNLHEEAIQGPNEPRHSSLIAAIDHKRTIMIHIAAHRTWYAFVWYCYTGRLNFSKLKSQLEPGAQSLPATHPDDGPPSCSPKSMYRLADLVGDKTLKAKALEAIEARMTEANVLQETFSIFTSKYPDVREVQLSALMKYFRSPGVKSSFLETMPNLISMPHAGPTLAALYDKIASGIHIYF